MCSRAALRAFLENHADGKRLAAAYGRAFGAAGLAAALEFIATAQTAVGSLALRATAVIAERPLVLLNGIPGGSASVDASWFDNNPGLIDPNTSLMYEPITFANLQQRLALRAPDAAAPIFLVWDGVGHFNGLQRLLQRGRYAVLAEPAEEADTVEEASEPRRPPSAPASPAATAPLPHPAFAAADAATAAAGTAKVWPARCPVAEQRGCAGGCGDGTSCKADGTGLLASSGSGMQRSGPRATPWTRRASRT